MKDEASVMGGDYDDPNAGAFTMQEQWTHKLPKVPYFAIYIYIYIATSLSLFIVFLYLSSSFFFHFCPMFSLLCFQISIISHTLFFFM